MREETNARRQATRGLVAWALYDWASNGFATIVVTFVFAAYFMRRVAENETAGSAQWGNAIGLAGLIVALAAPVLGAVADRAGRRKPWIAAFTTLCVVATALLWFVRPATSDVGRALVLVGTGMIGAEIAFVFYNAMLPSLAPRQRLGRWSGWAWGLGYAGGLLCLVLALVLFVRQDAWWPLGRGAAENVRATFLLAALWYGVFALPLFAFTPDARPMEKSAKTAVREGLRQIATSIRHVRRYRHIVRFLIARMIYIDALATVFSFGGAYAAGTFDMSEQQVLLFGITLNLTAGLGAAAFGWVDDLIGSKRTILISLVGLIVPGTLMLLVRQQWQFWSFGLLLGVFVGPVQAASRSFLARIAPEALRNEIFGLYALSGKGTAFVGPLLVGWLTYASGSQRIGMSSIIVLFAIGFSLMRKVPAAEETVET